MIVKTIIHYYQQSIGWSNGSKKFVIVFLQLLEELTENESRERWIKRREEGGKRLTEKLSSTIIRVVKRD